MRTFKPYPSYKESGISWLGKVPAHWEVTALRFRYSQCLGKMLDTKRITGVYSLPYLRNVDVQWDQINTEDLPTMDVPPSEYNRYTIRQGDVLVCEGGEVGRCAIWSGELTVCGFQKALHRLRPRNVSQDVPRFIFYAFNTAVRTNAFNDGHQSTIAHLTGDKIRAHRFSFPSLPEQAAIVRFLDHADRRIRRYIRAKEKLITLLGEQKQAIIHQAVTGRIDVGTGQPYPAYKPSGVEWLGDVPAHWEVRRLKWVTRLQRGYDLPADSRLPGPVPVVSSGGIIDTHVESRCGGPGVVMGRYGSTDAVFFIEQDFWPHNTSLFVTDFQGNFKKWCYYLLRTITKADHAGKSAVPGVDRKDLFQISVPLPPVEEQQEISGCIDSAMHKLSVVISQEQREIDLLREYRTRLIADVVTGKLDVREAAVAVAEVDPLADDEEDDDSLDTGDASPLDDGQETAEVVA